VDAIEGPYWSNEMGCATPTLAALAEQGVSFTSFRVNPNCSPTRAALMTGSPGV
jgi:arylsulfatase A-like enzyme